MSTLAELEEALHASGFDREHLAVYGDALEAAGDPRGELIAIDLHGATAETAARRVELERAWLGELAEQVESEYGFLAVSAHSGDVLAHPAMAYARTVEVLGDNAFLADALATLAAHARPHLTALAIRQWGRDDDDLPLAGETAVALVAATPRMQALDVAARVLFDELVHPAIDRLRISGCDALGSLHRTGPGFARLARLDLAFHHDFGLDHLDKPAPEVLATLLPPARLPVLRSLDLSRNEPGGKAPRNLGGAVDVFGWLRASAIAPQLERLRLPSLRRDEHVADAQRALDRMPALAELEVARNYGAAGALTHPRATVRLPPPASWPEPDSVHGRDALAIRVPGEPYHEYVDLSGIVAVMETCYETLAAPTRAAWDAFWDFLGDLGWDDDAGNAITQELPAVTLVAAITGTELDHLRRWVGLRDALARQPLAAGTTVAIRRYWGW